MAEESELLSGSHAREYLKLFRQEGRSLAGLVLLEIGWVLLLVLASKLTGAPRRGHSGTRQSGASGRLVGANQFPRDLGYWRSVHFISLASL